ncbi:MAG: hypothetical protein WC089_03595 [Candidatus Paceibacterota bacterium]
MKTEILQIAKFAKLLFKRESFPLCYVLFPIFASSLFLIFFSFAWKDLLNVYLDTTPKFAGVDIVIAFIVGFTLYCSERGFPIRKWF